MGRRGYIKPFNNLSNLSRKRKYREKTSNLRHYSVDTVRKKIFMPLYKSIVRRNIAFTSDDHSFKEKYSFVWAPIFQKRINSQKISNNRHHKHRSITAMQTAQSLAKRLSGIQRHEHDLIETALTNKNLINILQRHYEEKPFLSELPKGRPNKRVTALSRNSHLTFFDRLCTFALEGSVTL